MAEKAREGIVARGIRKGGEMRGEKCRLRGVR
jgi:hypothetical protein